MDDRELRSYEMLMRVDNFGDENAVSFPPASLGRTLFATVKSVVTQLATHVAQQVSGSTSARQGTATKAMAREALRDDLERIRRTARAMAITIPGIDSKFRIPRKATDQDWSARRRPRRLTPCLLRTISSSLPCRQLSWTNSTSTSQTFKLR